MRSKIALPWLTLSLWVLLVGCNNLSVQVTKAVPEERALRSEILDLRNCASNEDLRSNLATEVPIKLKITLAEDATSKTTGKTIVIPNEVKSNLISQIELTYQQAYDEALSNAERIELNVPAHKIHMYDIKWKGQDFSSTVSFFMDDQACIASYTYMLEIPELDGFRTMACTA